MLCNFSKIHMLKDLVFTFNFASSMFLEGLTMDFFSHVCLS